MNNEKINYIEASFLVIIVMITHIILNLPNMILASAGSASIINVIYISCITLFIFFIIEKLFTPFENKDILDVAEFVGGKTLKIILSAIYSLYLIFVSAILLRNFTETLKVVYFPTVATWTIILSFVLVAMLANKSGFRNVVKANTIILPVVLISVLFIFFSSIGKFETSRIFPLLGNGFNSTFISGAINIYSFGGLLYLYLIRPSLRRSGCYKKVGFISIIVSALYLFFSVASLLLLFPFLTSGKEVLSVYLSTRTIEFGKFFQRTDALFIFIWIFAFISYLSVIILYIVKINKKAVEIKNQSPVIYISGILIFIVCLIPKNAMQIRFLETNVIKYLALIIVFGMSFGILLIGFIKKKKQGFVEINRKDVKNES